MDAFNTLFPSFEDVPSIALDAEEAECPVDFERAGDPTFRGGACVIA
uniref:Putative pheromone n=1 Tax=Flammulina velutipes TaxID=38945 RepID=F1CZK9_FLAVE|nr:putative pheromone precursor [Flammulina velutipes]